MTRNRHWIPARIRRRLATADRASPQRSALALGVVMAVLLPIVACQNESRSIARTALSPMVAAGSPGYELFQAHCAACHGREGRGDGIAATFIGVAPRDFWNESFRYVSALDGAPTEDDLIQTIQSGRLPGQMPAGPWLTDQELTALAGYVRELNRLGWVDRLTHELEGEGTSPAEIQEIASERVMPLEVISVPIPARDFRPDTRVGRDLYLESCASCHGPTGRGDGLEMPLDELGRPIKVRDLTREPIHGGSDPIELFKRIRCGVPGTPMPAQEGLTDEQVWQLVYYTRLLAGRPANR